jgi:hypothetical protein
MGLYGEPPKQLMLELKEAFAIEAFLETGTFSGDTAAWAAEHFARVVTVEAAPQLHRAAAERHEHLGNVRFVLGDSRAVLREVVAELDRPILAWLDSHWSGGATHGAGDECPVLFEIETLRASPHDHFLFIDDARLFLAPPPRPHDRAQWPTLAQLVAALTAGERPLEVVVLHDAFVAVPAKAAELLRQHAQDAATRAWEERDGPAASAGDRLRAGAKKLADQLRALSGRRLSGRRAPSR